MISLRDAAAAGKQLIWCLIPSYIHNHYHDSTYAAPKKFATSSLDGLRGVAALFVFFFHILFSYTDFHEYGYGQSPEQTRIIQLPIIRLFYSGHAMVIIFFVVGGYVFSLKPLKLIRSGQSTGFLNTIVSSVFRRAIRLYAPAILATFLTMITLSLGLWEYQRQYITKDHSIIWYADNHIDRASSTWAQLMDWLHQTKLLTNVFTYYNDGFLFPYYPHYDPHLWTIPVEYRSSMLLAICLLGFSQCRPAARLSLEFATILFCMLWDRWELVCFLGGSMLCEIDIITNALGTSGDIIIDVEHAEPKADDDDDGQSFQSRPATTLTTRLSFKTHRLPLSFFSLIFALYLLSAPPLELATTPGYALFSNLIPSTYTDPKRFPHTLGTLILAATLTRTPWLRRPFDSDFAQYLGKISFSLYIVHGPLIHIVGYAVTPWIWMNLTGHETGVQWAAGLVMGSVVLGLVVAIIADWFWRVVECGSVEWAKRFERICFVG